MGNYGISVQEIRCEVNSVLQGNFCGSDNLWLSNSLAFHLHTARPGFPLGLWDSCRCGICYLVFRECQELRVTAMAVRQDRHGLWNFVSHSPRCTLPCYGLSDQDAGEFQYLVVFRYRNSDFSLTWTPGGDRGL